MVKHQKYGVSKTKYYTDIVRRGRGNQLQIHYLALELFLLIFCILGGVDFSAQIAHFYPTTSLSQQSLKITSIINATSAS